MRKPQTSHERRKANPDASDLTDPKEVWKDAETTPAPDKGRRSGMAGRVADAGDLRDGETPPYDTETQADVVGRQTYRKRDSRDGGNE